MAGSFLWEGISYGSRRSLVEAILPGFINRGVGANESLRIFKDAGYGIRRTDFLRLYSDIQGNEISSSRLGNVRRNFIPSDSVFAPSKYDFTDKYRVVVSGFYRDPESGALSPFHYAQDRNSLSSVADMEDEIRSQFEEEYLWLAGSLVSLRITRGYISPSYL